MRYLLVGLIVTLCIHRASSQDNGDCLVTLTQANEEFNAGRFFGIPSLLKQCLDNGFSTEQTFQAYYLLTQTYLILDDPIAAEDSYLKLLRADPEFVASAERDPIDLVYLSKKFTATPVFTPHFRFGGNVSFIRNIHEITTEGYDVNRSTSIKPGFQLGAGIDWNLNDNMSIGGEGLFALRSISTTRVSISIDDIQQSTERQAWLDVPIYFKYKDDIGKVRPFGYAGFAANLLLGSRVSLNTQNKTPNLSDTGGEVPTEGPDEKIAYKRNFFNYSFLMGGGAYYKIGKDFLFADVRYMAGMTNVTKESENYYNEDGTMATTIARYRWVGDYFRLDNLSISIGYVKPLYDPRKIRKARTKKVLREISKDED